MKNIIFPSMLVISLIAYAQYTQNFETFNKGNYTSELISNIEAYNIEFEINWEEEDATFDFNTKDYLPFDFDANSKVGRIEYEVTLEESDEQLDFNTANYLPIGFNPHGFSELSVVFELESEEEDAPFDFDTVLYLPQGFNPYKKLKQATDIVIR